MRNDCIIAIDQGNKLIKTAPFGYVFSAGINDHRDIVPITVKGGDLLKYEGNYYTVDSQHIPNCPNKAEERRYVLLTLMGIAKELIRAEEEDTGYIDGLPKNYRISGRIILALGLPPGVYSTLGEVYKKVFTNGGASYYFTYNDVDFAITVSDVFVYPQGFASIAASPEIMNKMKDTNISVIDIGGYTTDFCSLTKGDLGEYRTFDRLGMNSLYAAINASVQTKYGERLRDDQIDEILDPMSTSTQLEDVQMTVLEVAKTFANDLINQLREEGIQMQLSLPVFVGGGALRLRPYIWNNRNIRQPIWLEDICANARGFYEMTKSQLRAAKDARVGEGQ